MAHFLLFYDLADDYLERRQALRDQHLQLAWEAVERGELLIGGALSDPADQAVLLFSGDGPEVAISFAETDPYVLEGLVRDWKVRPWASVVGPLAAAPTGRPGEAN